MGYGVVIIWECKLKENFEKEMESVVNQIKSQKRVKVIAVIIIKDNRIFITQRGYGSYKYGWEFLDSKVELGETKEEELIREIQEELDMKIQVDSFFDTTEYDYPDFYLSMDCFICSIEEATPVPKEHKAMKWMTSEELDEVDFLQAAKELSSKLKMSISHNQNTEK